MRPELPADVDVLRIARPAARDDRDVVEAVSLTRLLAAADLYVQGAPSRCKKPRLDGSPGPEKPLLASPLKWQSIVSALAGRRSARDGLELHDLDTARDAARITGIEPAGADLERRCSSSRDRSSERLLDRLASVTRREETGQEHVAGPDRRECLDTRGHASEPLHLALLVEEREAARLLGDEDVARAELDDRVEPD